MMLVSASRFTLPFVSKVNVRTASGDIIAPAGTKTARIWALGPGGVRTGSGSYGYGGGGGEMRSAAIVAVSGGQALTLSLAGGQDTTVTLAGSVVVRACTAGSYGGYGGSGGLGGKGRSGGNGAGGDATNYGYVVQQGGGAGGPDGPGGAGLNNGNDSRAGSRGPGRSFTDADSGLVVQNGGGSQQYGGGRSGNEFNTPALGGFVAIEWLDLDLQSQVRVLTSQGSQVTAPSWAVRAEFFVLGAGNNGEYYYDEETGREYIYGGQGGNMYRREVEVTASSSVSFQGNYMTLGNTGNVVISTSLYDTVMSGGGGGYNGSAFGGGAAGTDGIGGQGSSYENGKRGPGRSFTDAVSGVTVQNGDGGQNYGGGARYGGTPAAGFGAVIFYNI